MKKGFTTGSCAAAASKAAAYMLLGGNRINEIEIDTPAGEKYHTEVEETVISEGYVRCAVRKQSGDDPDVTDGMLVFATVSLIAPGESAGRVMIEGGEGVGKVTRPGLDQPVGAAAINTVPRRMVETEVIQVMDLFDHEGPLRVEISVPGGRETALKTFNPRLGIEDGISIIGTTGIVEPMSTQAILDTILVTLRQIKCMGAEVAVISPGNYGMDFMKDHFGYDLDRAVKCSNYIGQTVDMAAGLGFEKMLLCGHIGKLIKVSGGIMTTHSSEADCRMELMAAAAIRCGAPAGVAEEILGCLSTEEAIGIYKREGIGGKCFAHIMERIEHYLDKRAKGRIDVQCIVYSNQYGLLGQTGEAAAFLDEAKGEVL